MSYNVKKLGGDGRALLRNNQHRNFDLNDILQLMTVKDKTEAIVTALYAGYAAGYQHAIRDRADAIIPFPGTGKTTD